MKLIIVQRSQVSTYRRLSEQFVDDRDVKVMLERRQLHRERPGATDTSQSPYERRRLRKTFGGRDYIVVYNTHAPRA